MGVYCFTTIVSAGIPFENRNRHRRRSSFNIPAAVLGQPHPGVGAFTPFNLSGSGFTSQLPDDFRDLCQTRRDDGVASGGQSAAGIHREFA